MSVLLSHEWIVSVNSLTCVFTENLMEELERIYRRAGNRKLWSELHPFLLLLAPSPQSLSHIATHHTVFPQWCNVSMCVYVCIVTLEMTLDASPLWTTIFHLHTVQYMHWDILYGIPLKPWSLLYVVLLSVCHILCLCGYDIELLLNSTPPHPHPHPSCLGWRCGTLPLRPRSLPAL